MAWQRGASGSEREIKFGRIERRGRKRESERGGLVQSVWMVWGCLGIEWEWFVGLL